METKSINQKAVATFVAKNLNLPVELIYKKAKFGNVPFARQITFYVLRIMGVTNREIAKEFKMSDSTVTTTYNRGITLFNKNENFTKIAKAIINEFETTD